MPFKANPLPPAADLWERYSYNPLTGEIFSLKRPNWRKPLGRINSYGYVVLNLKFAKRHVLVHRIIWKWVTGEEPAESLDHINRIKTDNRIQNLRSADALVQNRNHPRNVCTEETAKHIRERLSERGHERGFQRRLAEELGIHFSTISAINVGASWSP